MKAAAEDPKWYICVGAALSEPTLGQAVADPPHGGAGKGADPELRGTGKGKCHPMSLRRASHYFYENTTPGNYDLPQGDMRPLGMS